jgi:hypothetical protein
MVHTSWAPGGVLPPGMIVMWSGLLVNIPSGWTLCDGTVGTPDLRDRFLKGAAAGIDPGATGGAATHTHLNHAALSHVGVSVQDHAATATSGTTGTSLAGPVGSVVTPNTHTHQTPVLSHSVTNPSDHAAQAHTAANSEPAYFEIAYIMKT